MRYRPNLNKLMGEEGLTKRFYHFHSLQNFVHFFDELQGVQVKENVYDTLMEYLDIINEEPVADIRQCTELFDKYL